MEKALKINIKKILLLLSLLPYLIFLVTGIFNIYQTSIDKGYLDLYAFIEPLGNFWIEIIDNLNIILIFLSIFGSRSLFFFQAEPRIRGCRVTGAPPWALPFSLSPPPPIY